MHDRGRYYPQFRTILIRQDLGQAERRSTVAHELAHAELGHSAQRCPILGLRQETEANRRASRKLITVDQLVTALMWSQDEFQLAEELWVDVETVRARLAGLTDDERDYIERRLWEREESA